MPNIFVEPPRRNPRKGGLKSVIGEFVSVDRLPIGASVEWISEGCDLPKAAPGLCYVPNPITEDKTFSGIDTGSGPIFGLYAGVQCYAGPDADFDRRARKLLDEGEARGVEEVLWEWANTTAGAPIAATSIVNAVGQADEFADSYYVGEPVLMMSRLNAVRARAEGALFGGNAWDGTLWTANGTPAIASAAASDASIFVMGWPTVYRSDETVTRVVDPRQNLDMAIAERVYAIAVDCALVAGFTVPATA